MQCERTKDINVLQISCSDNDRHLPPTRTAIDAMKKSLETVGQINPISVYPITSNSYRLISGATRFRAASELQWETIRASIWIGKADEFEIQELVENVDRRELAGEQRRKMRARIKELQKKMIAEKLEAQKAEGVANKGGRGNKGGVRDAARQAGVSHRTAQRRQEDDKPAHNTKSEPVSDDAPPAKKTARDYGSKKQATDYPISLHNRIATYCEQQNISFSEGVRRLCRNQLDAMDLDRRLMKMQTV